MIRLRQTLIVAAGLVLAGLMVVLGIWQLDVYRAQGVRVAAERAAGPPVPLASVAPVGAAATAGYGRSVSFTGTYQAGLAELLPVEGSPGRFRVLSGLRQPDGSLVAVVRGLSGPEAPAPPAGPVGQVGVLLPSEDSADSTSAVSLPLLAQRWPGPLVDGYVNLSAADATAQGLEPAPLALPETPGRLRNGAYALQWWMFAGFALVFAVRMARDVDRRADLDAELADAASADAERT